MLRARALPAPPAPSPISSARTRWLWLMPLLGGLLAVFGWTVAHDPGPGLSLSNRGWLTVGLAALLALLLAAHRAARELARTVAEFAAVALLTMLLLTSSAHPGPPTKPAPKPPAKSAQTLDLTQGCGPVSLKWVACLWDHSKAKTKQVSPTTTTLRRKT